MLNAIILAAEGGDNSVFESYPRALYKNFSGITILESQINVMGYCGISPDCINVVIGGWKESLQKSVEEQLKAVGCGVVKNIDAHSTTSSESLKLALELVEDEESVIISFGETIITVERLLRLMSDSRSNLVAVRKPTMISDSNIWIDSGTKAYQLVSNDSSEIFNWYSFGGLMKLDSEACRCFLQNFESLDHRGALFSLDSELMKENGIGTIEIDSIPLDTNGRDANEGLIGGSFADLQKRNIVRKQASKQLGGRKIRNEVEWLNSVPDEISNHFPEVTDFDLDGDPVWFDMPFYNLPDLRKLIITGEYDAEKTGRIVGKVLEFMDKRIYSINKGPVPSDFFIDKHKARISNRWADLCRRSEKFRALWTCDKITINGSNYSGLMRSLSRIFSSEKIVEILVPDFLTDIHGDLHFQNILVNPSNSHFILADPRGEVHGSDPFYDLGKIFHSFNGKYDLIHTGQRIGIMDSNSEIRMIDNNPRLSQKYDRIGDEILKIIPSMELVRDDPWWELRALFNEVVHFSTVLPFHLDGKGESKAIAMFATSVILASEFIDAVPENLLGGVESHPEFSLGYLDTIDIEGIY